MLQPNTVFATSDKKGELSCVAELYGWWMHACTGALNLNSNGIWSSRMTLGC